MMESYRADVVPRTQQTPPNQVLIAIALFLTFFIMSPTLTSVYEKAGDPYLNGQIRAEAALDMAESNSVTIAPAEEGMVVP